MLEVGCGPGRFAARVRDELGAEVVAVDQSEQMVELARERGLDARLGDVQALAFGDGEFDCAVANSMLYHVPDVARALSELARVLRAGGRLVAATNGVRHLGELWNLVGRDLSERWSLFMRETGEELLRPHFAHVERHDCDGWVELSAAEMRHYIANSVRHAQLADAVPELAEPLRLTCSGAVFVADKAA